MPSAPERPSRSARAAALRSCALLLALTECAEGAGARLLQGAANAGAEGAGGAQGPVSRVPPPPPCPRREGPNVRPADLCGASGYVETQAADGLGWWTYLWVGVCIAVFAVSFRLLSRRMQAAVASAAAAAAAARAPDPDKPLSWHVRRGWRVLLPDGTFAAAVEQSVRRAPPAAGSLHGGSLYAAALALGILHAGRGDETMAGGVEAAQQAPAEAEGQSLGLFPPPDWPGWRHPTTPDAASSSEQSRQEHEERL